MQKVTSKRCFHLPSKLYFFFELTAETAKYGSWCGFKAGGGGVSRGPTAVRSPKSAWTEPPSGVRSSHGINRAGCDVVLVRQKTAATLEEGASGRKSQVRGRRRVSRCARAALIIDGPSSSCCVLGSFALLQNTARLKHIFHASAAEGGVFEKSSARRLLGADGGP